MSRVDVEVDGLALALRETAHQILGLRGQLPAAAGEVRPAPQARAGHVSLGGRPEQPVLLQRLHDPDDRRLGEARGPHDLRHRDGRLRLGQQPQDVDRALHTPHALGLAGLTGGLHPVVGGLLGTGRLLHYIPSCHDDPPSSPLTSTAVQFHRDRHNVFGSKACQLR
jgi:hypothetical protein